MPKIQQLQNKIEAAIKNWYTSLDDKKRSTVIFIPKIIVAMLFCTYFSGLIYTRTDMLISAISCILICIIILFLPLNKILGK